jgi:hypothetical protein
MPEQPSEPSKVRFRFNCQDADLLRLAICALQVYNAQVFAGRHRLPLDEGPTAGDVREFTLLVDTRRLEAALLGLRCEGLLFGPIECADQGALEICQELGVQGELRTPTSDEEGSLS